MLHMATILTSLTSLVYISLFFTYAIGAPTGGPIALSKRQRSAQECMNAKKNISPDCWTTLGVDEYVRNWWQQNSQLCNTDASYKDQGFASCYQQIVGKGEHLNEQCGQIQVSGCQVPGNFSSYSPQEYYVLYSIFGIWQYFNSITYGSDFANGITSARIGEIVTTINPVSTDKFGSIALGVISAALAFLPVPGVGAAVTTITKTLTTALQQTPGIVKTLQAPATIQGQFDGASSIQDTLADLTTAFRTNVANVLAGVQSDVDSFLAFAANGAFIAPAPSLNASTSLLTDSLTTYVTSQALQSKGYYIDYMSDLPSAYPEQWRLADGGYWRIGNSDGSPLADRDKAKDIVDQIISKQWSTADQLLVGARECAVAVLVANGDKFPAPYVDPKTLQPYCTSNLDVKWLKWNPPVAKPNRLPAAGAGTPQLGCQFESEGPGCLVVDPFLEDREKLGGLTQREFHSSRKVYPVDKYLVSRGL